MVRELGHLLIKCSCGHILMESEDDSKAIIKRRGDLVAFVGSAVLRCGGCGRWYDWDGIRLKPAPEGRISAFLPTHCAKCGSYAPGGNCPCATNVTNP